VVKIATKKTTVTIKNLLVNSFMIENTLLIVFANLHGENENSKFLYIKKSTLIKPHFLIYLLSL
jgi:hypothetical protein